MTRFMRLLVVAELDTALNDGDTNLSELHDEVHEAAGGRGGHGARLQQVLDPDLVLHRLVHHLLA